MDLLNVRYLRSAFCIYYVVCSRRHGSQIRQCGIPGDNLDKTQTTWKD